MTEPEVRPLLADEPFIPWRIKPMPPFEPPADDMLYKAKIAYSFIAPGWRGIVGGITDGTERRTANEVEMLQQEFDAKLKPYQDAIDAALVSLANKVFAEIIPFTESDRKREKRLQAWFDRGVALYVGIAWGVILWGLQHGGY